MELDQFVTTTLGQILQGVRDAQSAAREIGAIVNPTHSSGTFGHFHSKSGTYIQNVEFDVALTVTESKESGAGLRVGISWVGGGVQGNSERSHSAANRVRFTVPLLLPRQL